MAFSCRGDVTRPSSMLLRLQQKAEWTGGCISIVELFLKETRMSVNNISSNNAGALLQAFTQRKQDLASLASALGSGDVASAQTALSAFQQDLQNLPSQAQDPATQSALASDLKLLQSDLNSNNVSDARNVFNNLLQDLQSVQHGHRHHGHQQYTTHG